VPGQEHQHALGIEHVAGSPYRFWRRTLSRSTTRFFSALQDAFTGRLLIVPTSRTTHLCRGDQRTAWKTHSVLWIFDRVS
jgi:hypothetical protein